MTTKNSLLKPIAALVAVAAMLVSGASAADLEVLDGENVSKSGTVDVADTWTINSGGTLTQTGNITMRGTVNLYGDWVWSSGNWGMDMSSVFNVYSGGHWNYGTASIQTVAGSPATVNIYGGTVTAGKLVSGTQYNATGNGIINQSAGTVDIANELYIRAVSGYSAQYNISGGNLSAGTLELSANGKLSVSGATTNVEFDVTKFRTNIGFTLDSNTEGSTSVAAINAGVLGIAQTGTPTIEITVASGARLTSDPIDLIYFDRYALVTDSWSYQMRGNVSNITLAGNGVDVSEWYLQAVDVDGGGKAIQLVAVPEPATMGLLGLGLAGILMRRRKK